MKFFFTNLSAKLKPWFQLPYQDHLKRRYKAYFLFSGILALFIFIFSFVVIINLSVNGKYTPTGGIDNLNLFLVPIFNLLIVIASLVLLWRAPHRVHFHPKHSSIMFYTSFWFLVVATLLNSGLQVSYGAVYGNTSFYAWLPSWLLTLFVVVTVLSLFFLQLFFWIMRRKWSFMPSDYAIYTERIETKRKQKAAKAVLKLQAKAKVSK